MRILFISKELVAHEIAYRLKLEGHEVKLYIDDATENTYFNNLVAKTDDWKKEIPWVGKKGLIIFDNTGYGKEQDRLRAEGYVVFGGSEAGERIELDRHYGHQIFESAGLNTVALHDFPSIDDASNFIKNNPKRWVLKFTDNLHAKNLMFIAQDKESDDLLKILEQYSQDASLRRKTLTLQEFVDGIEVGVARYFNGTHWVGPIEYNVEHTKLFPGNIGPTVDEMGTVAWYAENASEKLYKSVLAPLEKTLKQANFRGDFGINCIVNKSGVFPLEATARIGCPICHIQTELHKSPWGEFLYAIASGQDYALKYYKDFAVVTVVCVPPFPYSYEDVGVSMQGCGIDMTNVKEEDWEHIHYDEIAAYSEASSREIYIAGPDGYLFQVTRRSKTIDKARKKTLEIIDRIPIPKKFYRNDIGTQFESQDLHTLKRWGYYATK